MFLMFVLSCAVFYPLFSMKEEDNYKHSECEKYSLVFFKDSSSERLQKPTLEEWVKSVKRHNNKKKIEYHFASLRNTFCALIDNLEKKNYEFAYMMFKQIFVIRMQIYSVKNNALVTDLENVYNYHLEPAYTPFADQFTQEKEDILKERNIISFSNLDNEEKEKLTRLIWDKCYDSLMQEVGLRLNKILVVGERLIPRSTKKRCIIY